MQRVFIVIMRAFVMMVADGASSPAFIGGNDELVRLAGVQAQLATAVADHVACAPIITGKHPVMAHKRELVRRDRPMRSC
jgi:hypothetical protein